jgi:uncharacterized protein (DUF2147 family)
LTLQYGTNHILGIMPSITVCRNITTVLLLAAGAISFAGNADRIVGRWYTEKNEAIFEFYKQDTVYNARLIPLKYPDFQDSHNPVDSLRSRKVKNLTVVRGLTYNAGKERWERGTIYNPGDGRNYSCLCRLLKDTTKMQFRGYIGISALGGTRIFTRIVESDDTKKNP